MRKIIAVRLAALAGFALVAAPALAQEEMPPANIVNQTFDITPMPGHGPPFEDGVRDYMAWAAEQGNDWTWICWEVIAGENTGQVRFGTYGHTWADFDSPPVDPAATSASIDRLIAPHVQDVVTTYSVARADLSNYGRTEPASMYMIFSYQVKLGHVQQFEATMKRYRDLIVEHAPEVEYVVHQTVLGAEAGQYLLAVPMEGMASMAEAPNIDGMLQEALGTYAWQQLTEDFYASISSEKSSVVVMRPDMSLMPAE